MFFPAKGGDQRLDGGRNVLEFDFSLIEQPLIDGTGQ
jgi:hypothetical protein